jgi:UDP-2-acetamido-2,6-beta-L-arabino-hexul-4-ose reductase
VVFGEEIVKIGVTGSRGFIGLNLCARLRERGVKYFEIHRDASNYQMHEILAEVDAVIHLAGVNRPNDPDEYLVGNAGFTQELCSLLAKINPVPVIFASSIQAELNNPYGRSKRLAEDVLENYGATYNVRVHSERFPNVFGKWSRPNYNSAVATFCDAIANGKPFEVHNPSVVMKLVYIDDVIDYFISYIEALAGDNELPILNPIYESTLGEIVEVLWEFRQAGSTLHLGNVGVGFRRALYSTYVSFFRPEGFAQQLTIHSDSRGDFVEMMRTPSAGQFSYFTAHPGVTRGGHYHHSKTEKFLVVSGAARFRFRNLLTGERFERDVKGGSALIVDSIPGWVHDVTNVGNDLLIVMLWANEVFDPGKPDTVSAEL